MLPDDVILASFEDDLRDRYEDSPANSVEKIREENPNINWRVLTRLAKKLRGLTVAEYLQDIGALHVQDEAPAAGKKRLYTASSLVGSVTPANWKPRSGWEFMEKTVGELELPV